MDHIIAIVGIGRSAFIHPRMASIDMPTEIIRVTNDEERRIAKERLIELGFENGNIDAIFENCNVNDLPAQIKEDLRGITLTMEMIQRDCLLQLPIEKLQHEMKPVNNKLPSRVFLKNKNYQRKIIK